jgi:flagellar basal body-associated protein FliL
MEGNLQQPAPTPTVSVNPTPPQPQAQIPQQPPAGKKPLLKNILLVVIVLAVVGGIAYGGYMYLNSNKVYNATVYENNKLADPTPTPLGYQSNPSDTTDQALTKDSAQADKDLNSVDTELNNANQSLSDQQTNLQ